MVIAATRPSVQQQGFGPASDCNSIKAMNATRNMTAL
jgi:hypothetical protein